ncbi:hypothetical protein RhiLY_11766 [Ceratobasidium sp. AG-Ba]|nr:hypothetical protein RhiLY_11766 [Ceratobasidium sp. AG-Ba]
MATPRRAPSPSASTTYSGISNYRSESYRTGPTPTASPRPGAPNAQGPDPRVVARTHYEELKRSLQDHMLREPQNSRANAREKLTRLTRQQFQELSTDVYDELMRRNNNEKGGAAETPFLPVRDDFHPKRNQARQKLATLPPIRFKDLSSDVFYELGRRYPEFKEPETLPETPDTPQSDYDPPTPELVGGRAPMRQGSRDMGGAGMGAGSGSDRRRPSQDDYGVRRRPSQDEPRRQPSVDGVRRRPSGDEGPFRRPSQDAQVTRRPSQDKPSGMASSSYVTPNKSTIAEEVIQVPYGRDEGTEDEDFDDREDTAQRPGSEEDAAGHGKKPSQGGLHALGFGLLSTPLSPTSDDGTAPNGLNGRATSDYYEKMSFGRASVTSSQGGGGGGERRNTAIEDVRKEYEFKIATMQNRIAALENEARAAADRERDLRRTLSDRDSELVRVRDRCEQLEDDLQDAQSGQPNGAPNGAATEQLRREMQTLLEDLREMAASRDDLAAERDADTQTIRELSSQMQEYKRKYEAAKTELRGLKATSQLYVQQPANISKQDQLPISERGGIVDTHITAFQSAMDTMLMAARSSAPSTALTAMKSVVTSVSAIGDDVESYMRRSPGDHEAASQLVERLRATLSNLVAAARTHAMSYGTSPVSLLDAAASHVSTTVTSLVREVLVRRDDGRKNSQTGNVHWAHIEDELNGHGKRSDSSSMGSPSHPAIFDTPVDSAGSDEGWEELKPYLEAQSESIAFSIQALLSAIRTGAQGPEVNEHLSQIITIVSSIIAVSKDSLPRGQAKQGMEIVAQLTEQCGRLSELQGKAELNKTERQTIASNSFGVAKAMKELMKLA